MRANPFHTYRGFSYYASAGVYRLTLPDGDKVSFGAKQGSLQGLRNYVDAYIEAAVPSYPVAANPRALSKAEKAQRAKKRPVAHRDMALLAHLERRGAGAGKHHTRTRDEETGRARRPKHGGRDAYVERENPSWKVGDKGTLTVSFTVRKGGYFAPPLDDELLEHLKHEIGAVSVRRTTEGHQEAAVFTLAAPYGYVGNVEPIYDILRKYVKVVGHYQTPSSRKPRKPYQTPEERDAFYAEMHVDAARRKAATKRPPPEVTPRKRLAAKGSARPKYPLDLRANPLSGKEGLHIVAKRRSPHARGPEFSFSYSTRTPVMGVVEGQGGKSYATRTYMEDWKVNAEDLLSEYDAGYYADADITIFALDARGTKYPLTLSGVRSMATSGSLPARRAANPRYR